MNIASKRLSLLLLLFSVTAQAQFVIDPIQPSPSAGAPVPLIQPLTVSPSPFWDSRSLFGGPAPRQSDPFGAITPSFNYSWNFAGADEQFDIQIDESSDPYSQYAIDDIFGCEAPQSYNLEITEGVDFNTCFERNRTLVQPATDLVHLENDVAACNCLRNSALTDVKNIMDLTLDQNSVINVNTRVRRVYQSGMDQVINGVAFQANVIARNASEEVRKSFVDDYSKNPFPYNPNNPQVLIPNGKRYSLNLQPTPNPRLGRDDIPYPEIKDANGNSTPVCLSMVAFHRMRQLPEPRDFQYISPDLNKDFDDKDWDYNELQEDYDDLMGKSAANRLSKASEIAELKTKLSFLNRNPLLKYFMGADKDDYNEALKGGEAIGNFDLKAKKNELFGLVKNSLNKEECRSASGILNCGEELRTSLSRFFGNPNHSALIGEIVRSQMRKDIEGRAKKASKTIDKSLPDQQLNQPELMSRFEREFNIQRPVDCRVSTDLRNINETTDQCLKKMSAYCQYLKPYEARISKSSAAAEDPRIADTLASDLEDDFNTDPSTNEAFKAANQAFCHTKFQKKDGSQSETFFEFLNGYCSSASNEGCARTTSADWDKLRKKYNELYLLESQSHSLGGKNGTHDIVTAVTSTTEGGGTTGSAGGGGSGGGGSGSGEDDPFLGTGPVNPNCRKFCLGSNNRNSSSDGGAQIATIDDPSKRSFATSVGEIVKETTSPTSKTGVTQTPDNFYTNNYQSDSVSPTETVTSQNIASKEVQEQIINQLQEKVDEVAASNPTSPELRGLQADLAAIRAAFAQSQLANKSLTDKIAALERAQEIMARNELGTPAPEQQVKPVAGRGRSIASIPNPRVGLSELDRTISSVRETPGAGQANVGGSLSGGAQRGRVSGGSEFSSDAIRREESKLINVENTVDGKLTITTNPRATGVTPNGVSVEVPMTLYQTIQSNPEGIDLSQIRISDVQKSQVGDREFTLLVSSGDGNPPFKVQVQIKNNRLVRADSDNDGRPDRQVQTVRLENLNLIFRPIIQARN